MYKIQVPIKVPLSKKKNFSLNLNAYRNAHYMTLNKAKHVFEEIVSPKLIEIPKLTACTFDYYLYVKSIRKLDISNVCAVVDKFFSDTFVNSGHLIDDNYKYLKDISYHFGGFTKSEPYVEIHIKNKEN